MAELIVKYPDRAPDRFPLGGCASRSAVRPATTSVFPILSLRACTQKCAAKARNISCRISARPTERFTTAAQLKALSHSTAGGRIQIGETEIVFDDGTYHSSMGATMITDNSSTRFLKPRSRWPRVIAPPPVCSKRSKALAQSPKREWRSAWPGKATCSR